MAARGHQVSKSEKKIVFWSLLLKKELIAGLYGNQLLCQVTKTCRKISINFFGKVQALKYLAFS